MNVLEAQFLEPVSWPDAPRGRPDMNTNFRTGEKVTARVFGPGIVLETPGGETATMVPWGNVRWCRVETAALLGAKR